MQYKVEGDTLVSVYGDGTQDVHFTCPEGVATIGEYAFSLQTNLTRITLPQGLTQIGRGAFFGCTNLTSITLPQGLTQIEECAFSGCTNLTSITLPQGLTQIGMCAFFNCTNLKYVIIDTEDNNEMNRMRSLLPEYLKGAVVKKPSYIYIHWVLTIKEAFSNSGVPQDVSNIITCLVFSNGNDFFSKGNTVEQLQALALIEKEVERLKPSNQQNNTFLGLSLGWVYQDSDSKITSLQALKKIIEANPSDLATQVEEWEENNKEVLSTQRTTIVGGIFNNPIPKTQEVVQKIKEVLGLVKVEVVDGFVVCK